MSRNHQTLDASSKSSNQPKNNWISRLSIAWKRFIISSSRSHQSNAVYTSKYTILSFVPKCLIYQFSRFASIYFLSIGVMQLFPVISDSGGLPTALIPLFIVIVVSSAKDLVEDLRRQRSDAEENNREAKICESGQVFIKKWADLHVGDIIKIERNERVPADVVVLGSSGQFGISYVETKSLDGETNLKHKVAIPEVNKLFTNDREASHSRVLVKCGPAAASLYVFDGTLEAVYRKNTFYHNEALPEVVTTKNLTQNLSSSDPLFELNNAVSSTRDHSEVYDIEILKGPFNLRLAQLMLRGTSLVNTAWVYGLIVYVSKDTRIFQNANTRATFKWSHLERTFNRHVLFLVLFEFLFCVMICVGTALMSRYQWYLAWPHQITRSTTGELFINNLSRLTLKEQIEVIFTVLGSMFILFAYFIPIDLFLTLEIVRFLQALFVTWDKEMTTKDACAPTSQGAHLLEELGNITHIFTDKTGTLTKNVMILRALGIGTSFIGTKANAEKITIIPSSSSALDLLISHSEENQRYSRLQSSRSSDVSALQSSDSGLLKFRQDVNDVRLTSEFCSVPLNDLCNTVQQLCRKGERQEARSFLLALATCHTVLVREEVLLSQTMKEPSAAAAAAFPIELKRRGVTPEAILLSRTSKSNKWQLVSPPLVQYDASSPDELSFVCASQSMGLEFYRRTSLDKFQLRLLTPFARCLFLGNEAAEIWDEWEYTTTCLLPTINEGEIQQQQQHGTGIMNDEDGTVPIVVDGPAETITRWVPVVEMKLLEVLEFDNERRRMSVIISDPWSIQLKGNDTPPPHDRIRLLTKGADTSILEVIADGQRKFQVALTAHIQAMAENGLRTLAFGQRSLSLEEFEAFHRKLVEARALTIASLDGEDTITDLVKSIECNLEVIGSSGVEDRLQDEVSEVIKELRSCDIHFWVLTGDKPETAINIGYSTRLLTSRTFNAVIDSSDRKILESQLAMLRKSCESSGFLYKNGIKKRSTLIESMVTTSGHREERTTKNFSGPSQIKEESRHASVYQASKIVPQQQVNYSARQSIERLTSLESLSDDADSEDHFHAFVLKNDDQFLFAECLPDDTFSGRSTPQIRPLQSVASASLERCHDTKLKGTKQSKAHFFNRVSSSDESLACRSHSRAASLHCLNHLKAQEALLSSRQGGPPHTSILGRCKSLTKVASRLYYSKSASPGTAHSPHLKAPLRRRAFSNNDVVPPTRGAASSIDSKTNRPPDALHAEFSITITGAALDVILKRRTLLVAFYRLARHACVVIACRVTPKQKSLLVKQSTALNPECCSSLAVGDGANDVAMILSASVGVGISGKEGLQATRAADFSIAEFRFLRKLLFVHGRESLRRNSFLMYYGIFKNIAFCVASFVYQFNSGFSGQDIYNFWMKSLYGTLFVAPTVILYASFDRELPHYILQRSPATYRCLASVMFPVERSISFGTVVSSLKHFANWMIGQFHLMFKRRQSECRSAKECLPSKTNSKFGTQDPFCLSKRCSLITFFSFHRLRTIPANVRSYGDRLLIIWFIYAVFVGSVITLLPLHILKNATSIDSITLLSEMKVIKEMLFDNKAPPDNSTRFLGENNMISLPKELSQGFTTDWRSSLSPSMQSSMQRKLDLNSMVRFISRDEGKSGFDLASVGMVVMFQCIVICNLVVLLAVNSLFWFQALVMVGTMLLFLAFWGLTSWPWLVTELIPGLETVWGTFDMIQKCTSYYFGVFLSIFICILPVFSARACKVMFEPAIVTIIKERMLQGVFDIVIGRKEKGGNLVVFVPQREPRDKNSSSTLVKSALHPSFHSQSQQSIHSLTSNSNVNLTTYPSELLESFSLLESETDQAAQAPKVGYFGAYYRSSKTATPPIDAYTGFAFGFEETIISAAPSVWTLACLASWAGQKVSTPFIHIGRGMGTKLREVSTGFRRRSDIDAQTIDVE